MKKVIAGVVAGAVVVGAVWFFTSTDKTVATVNGVKITASDFNTQLQQNQGKTVLKKMIDDQIIRNEASADGITATDAEVQAQLNDLIQQQFQGDQSKFQDALKQYNITLDDLKKNITTNVLAEKIATKDIKITDKDIQTYYDQNKATLGTPEQIHAKHILVKDEATAKQILAEVQADPSKWDALAKADSIDPSNKDKGGDLGTFGKGTMVKEFEDAAFAAKPGTIVGPVHSQFGYHIIYVLEHKQASVPPLSQVKDKIMKTLKDQKAVPMNTLLTNLEKKEKVVINLSGFQDVLNPPADPSAQQGGQTGAGGATQTPTTPNGQ